MAEFVKVIAAGPGWTKVQDETGRVLTLDGNRNWRNNNPGNIEYGPFARSMGAIGSDGRFAVFPSYEAGRQAKEGLLFSSGSYANKTLEQAISKYAPPNENNTQAYINAVAGSVGITPNTVLSSLNQSQRQAVLDAMERVEGYKVGEIRNAQGVKLPPAEVPQVATALDVINRAAPMPATPTSTLGYARSDTPAGMPIVPTPMPRPERQRTAPTPATQSLPMRSIRAANSANRPELQAALQSQVNRSTSAPMPATPSFMTDAVRSGRVPLGNSISNRQTPVGLMDLASSPNAATPRLQSDGSVRSPMSTPPMPASVEQRVTARNNPPPMPPVPRAPPPRSYGQSSVVQDSFAALPSAARPDLQAALNNYAGNGIGSMPSMGDMAAFSGADIPDRLPQGSAELPGPWTGQPTQTAQMPPLPQPRPQTGIGGPLPPMAPPMPTTVQPVAPVAPPVPQPRLQRPGIFGKPMIGNWEVPLPGIFGGIQNFTAAMNNASGPFNNGFDNLLSTTMRGGNFLAPGAAVGQAGGFLYARNPGGGFTNVGRVDNSLTPAQRYDALNRRQPTNAADRMRENSRKFDSDTPQSLVG